MSINVNEADNFFSILTDNTEYQIKADENGVLKHIWYGRKMGMDMEYMLFHRDLGGAGNIYEMKENRAYSLNNILLEYPCAGAGDFRIPAFDVTFENGTRNVDLRYKGYKIIKGKYSIPKLPHVYDNGGEGETLEIYLGDTVYNLSVTLRYGVLPEKDIITRSVVIKNNSSSAIKIENAMSVGIDFPIGEWDWIHFYGRHTLERQPERARIMHGIGESSTRRGISSHQQNPSAVICSTDCTETHGECYGVMLVYSGSFSCKVQSDEISQTRMVMGINPDLFSWNLGEGEEFYTPEAVLSFSGDGLEKLSHNFHNVIRNNVCRGKYKLGERPVLINNWEATYFDFDEDKLVAIAKQASESGVDMFVMDDGWFGKRDNDKSGLGDWYVNTKKLKRGLKPLVDRINSYGMKFGIWFEPEMISEDSELFRKHPDWAIRIPGRNPVISRYQLVLDISREDVRDYIYNAMSTVLKSADISYVKWDMNRSICDWYSADLLPEEMGEMPHRYVLGLYDLLERLTGDFPDVLFEGCSAGGGRFDAGMLYYYPQIWCSDDTDAYERTKIQYGTSFFYPVSTVGSHVSAVPNHQTGRITPMKTRGVVAMSGSFGYELDLNTLSDDEKQEVKEQIKHFKSCRKLIHNGKYYRLSNPVEDNYAAWQYVSSDKSEILLFVIQFRTHPNVFERVSLRDLPRDKRYVLENDNTVYTGAALTDGGVLLSEPWGDYVPYEFHFKEEK